MEIDKVKSNYCTHNEVQVMFSNAPSQVILSKDGYLYLQQGDTTIHRYLINPTRKQMPYGNTPVSNDWCNHLFSYNQIYAKFTSRRCNGVGPNREDLYSLTFLYFVRTENGEAICVEKFLSEFDVEEETSEMFTREELIKFLYDIEGVDAKCIFTRGRGIEYVSHRKEEVSITNDKFLMLSDEAIIKKYNRVKEPMILFNVERRNQVLAERAWEVNSIEEIKDFSLTSSLPTFIPILLVIKGNEMYTYEMNITFCEKDCFKVESTKRKIVFSPDDILSYANSLEYIKDPL